jgi:O-antigen/teichoic acid export membrane protein
VISLEIPGDSRLEFRSHVPLREIEVMFASLSRRLASILITSLCLLAFSSPVSAQIVEERRGEANPMVSVFKSTLYGGAAGLVLGLAVELIDSGSDGDAAKWGFVGGAFFGFGYGIYYVSTRPSPGSAMLERKEDGFALAFPRPELLVREPARWSNSRDRSTEIRAPLAVLHF